MLNRRSVNRGLALLVGTATTSFRTLSEAADLPDRRIPKLTADAPQWIVVGKRIDDIDSLDPLESFSFSSAEIIGNLYDTLVVWDARSRRFKGGLAKDYRREAGGIHDFTLAQRHFSSGKPVTAEDVAFSLQRIFDAPRAADYIFEPLRLSRTGIDAPTTDRVRITLPSDAAARLLLPILSSTICSILDKTTVQANLAPDPTTLRKDCHKGPDRCEYVSTPDQGQYWLRYNSAGSGQFTTSSRQVSLSKINDVAVGRGKIVAPFWADEILLERNHRHPEPPASAVLIRHMPSGADRWDALEHGTIQVARDLPQTKAASAVSSKAGRRYVSVAVQKASTLLLCMSVANERFANADVRRFIRTALDPDDLGRKLGSPEWSPQKGMLPSALALGAARESTAHPDIKAPAPGKDPLFLDYAAGTPASRLIGHIIDALARVGVRVVGRPASARALMDRVGARQFELALLTWQADYFDAHSFVQSYCVNSEAENANCTSRFRTLAWHCGWVDERAAEMARKSAGLTDRAERAAAYAEIETRLAETGPYVWLFEGAEVALARDAESAPTLGVIDGLTRYASRPAGGATSRAEGGR